MTPPQPGEPWFLVSLGAFGSQVAETLEKDGKYRLKWQPPTLSLRVEEGEEHRHSGDRAEHRNRRRAGIETVKLDPHDASACFAPSRGSTAPGEGYSRIESALRAAFLSAYHAGNYLARRSPGDNRAVEASVAILLDFAEPFARSALVAVLDVLPKIARDLLAPLFQAQYRNLEVVVIGTAPIAEMGVKASEGTREALDSIEERLAGYHGIPGIAPELRAPGGPDIRVFVIDDRSDRYVLQERDRVEAVALFVGAVFGAGMPNADPFREIRSPAGERGRWQGHRGNAVFGTFSVASLSYPGKLVERYCELRQEWEVLQVLASGARDKAKEEIDQTAQRWLANERAIFEAELETSLNGLRQAGADLGSKTFAFANPDASLWQPIGFTASHLALSDPNHREIGWPHEPGFTIGDDGIRVRTYWTDESEAIGRRGDDRQPTLDRTSLGVQVVQPETVPEEARPQPWGMSERSTWLLKVREYTHGTLNNLVPGLIHGYDSTAPGRTLRSRQTLRERIDEILPGTTSGLSEAKLWLEGLDKAVLGSLKDARAALGAVLPPRERPPGVEKEDAANDWAGKFWAIVSPYHEWRRVLELRELPRRAAIYSAATLALWFLLVFPAAPAVEERLSNPFIAAAVALLFGSVIIFGPMAWDAYENTARLREGLEKIRLRLEDLKKWLQEEFFGKRREFEERLWLVRWLTLLHDEVVYERNEVERVWALLQASIAEVQAELEAMGVPFKEQRDGSAQIDDDWDFDDEGLFQRWYLLGRPVSSIYKKRREVPEKLAEAFLRKAAPYSRWREDKPFTSHEPLRALVAASWSGQAIRNPFEGAFDDETRAAIRDFLLQFASATRSPLHVRTLPSHSVSSSKDGDGLDWTVFAAAPVPALKSVLNIAREVGLDLEPAGQMPLDRVMVVRTLVNVARDRLQDVLPALRGPHPQSDGTTRNP